MFKDDYLKKLMEAGSLETSRSDIALSIKESQEFIEYDEWRMGTCAEIKISLNSASAEPSYDVSVIYDHKFGCTCPTLDRAIQLAGLYLQLIIKLDQQVGWPSNA